MHETLNLVCQLKECNRYYESPVTLPCGQTICQEHVDLNQSDLFFFKCPFCQKKHKIPAEGFSLNQDINTVLKDQCFSIQRREAYEAIEQLELIVKRFEDVFKPETFIWDYFYQVRNEIDIQREELIQQNQQDKDILDLKSEILLYQLKDLEEKCKQNRSEFHLKKKFLQLKERLRDPAANVQEIFSNVSSMYKNISIEIKQFKESLIMHKIVLFIPLNNSSLGKLIIKDIELKVNHESGLLVRTLSAHGGRVNCVESNDNFNTMVSCADDRRIKIWSTESTRCLYTLTGRYSMCS
jgi:hypothetical protein